MYMNFHNCTIDYIGLDQGSNTAHLSYIAADGVAITRSFNWRGGRHRHQNQRRGRIRHRGRGRGRAPIHPVIYYDANTTLPAMPDPGLQRGVEEGLRLFNTFLEGRMYAAGSELTLADRSLMATVSTMYAAGISFQPYPNVEQWYELVTSIAPHYEELTLKGIDQFKQFISMLTTKTEL